MLGVISKIPKIPNAVDVKIAMKDLYETRFGIHNHLEPNKDRPLASVAYHPSEDINENSRLQKSMENYIDFKINEFWSINYLEYIELPIDVIDTMHRVAVARTKKKSEANKEVENELKKATKP